MAPRASSRGKVTSIQVSSSIWKMPLALASHGFYVHSHCPNALSCQIRKKRAGGDMQIIILGVVVSLPQRIIIKTKPDLFRQLLKPGVSFQRSFIQSELGFMFYENRHVRKLGNGSPFSFLVHNSNR